MGAMPSRAQSESYKGLLPIELSVEAPTVFTADLRSERFANEQPCQENSRPFARSLITFCIGVAAALTWQSYNDAAKKIIAGWSPQFAWLAPQAPVARTVPDTIEHIITRIADRIVQKLRASAAADSCCDTQARDTSGALTARSESAKSPHRLAALTPCGVTG